MHIRPCQKPPIFKPKQNYQALDLIRKLNHQANKIETKWDPNLVISKKQIKRETKSADKSGAKKQG